MHPKFSYQKEAMYLVFSNLCIFVHLLALLPVFDILYPSTCTKLIHTSMLFLFTWISTTQCSLNYNAQTWTVLYLCLKDKDTLNPATSVNHEPVLVSVCQKVMTPKASCVLIAKSLLQGKNDDYFYFHFSWLKASFVLYMSYCSYALK